MMKRCVLLIWFITQIFAGKSQRMVVRNDSFVSVYDAWLKVPTQVEWVVARHHLGLTTRMPSWRFLPDCPLIGSIASHDDYTKSGYDRGHMCPAADRSASLSSMVSTFVISNIAPQTPAVNRGAWLKTENAVRNMLRSYDSIHVVAVPLFLDRDTIFIGAHRVAVPHAFIKAAWLPSNDSIVGLWFIWNRF